MNSWQEHSELTFIPKPHQKSTTEWRPRIEFSPAILFPARFDVQKRIQELRSYLDPNNPNYQPEQQHINIKAAILLYEDGKIDGGGKSS